MLSDLMVFYPTLHPEEILMLPNETVDAITTVAAIRSYSKTLNAVLVSGNCSEDTSVVLRGKIASLRSGLEEDNDAEISSANDNALNRQYGMPVANTTDDALQSMGFVNKTPKNKPDQDEDEV